TTSWSAAAWPCCVRCSSRNGSESAAPRYRHDAKRKASRDGLVRGELVLGGRRVAVQRPRRPLIRTVVKCRWRHGSRSKEDPHTERAVEQMMMGVATRKYDRSLQTVSHELETRGTSNSAVSWRFLPKTIRSWDGKRAALRDSRRSMVSAPRTPRRTPSKGTA